MRYLPAIAMLTILAIGPALAQSKCIAPTPPHAANGDTATLDEIHQTVQQAKDFIAMSDDYQACLQTEIEAAQKEASFYGVPVDSDFVLLQKARADLNQKQKEDVGAAANGAVQAYHKIIRNRRSLRQATNHLWFGHVGGCNPREQGTASPRRFARGLAHRDPGRGPPGGGAGRGARSQPARRGGGSRLRARRAVRLFPQQG